MSNDPKANANPQIVAGEPDKQGGTKMIWVGCKLPNGLICELGSRDDENYRAVRLNGANDTRVIGGYGLTQVSEAFWNAWVKKHARLDFVKKALVFVEGDRESAEAHAAETAEVKTGLEPLDPLKKITNPETGDVLLEVDTGHFAQGRRDMARLGGAPVGRAPARR